MIMAPSVLDKWINPIYLGDDAVERMRQDVLAKPGAKYIVLDNFFLEDKIEELIKQHKTLQFSEELDRRAPGTGEWLPYDGALVYAKPGTHVGSDLFFDEEWHRYLAYLTHCRIDFPTQTDIKLRWHQKDAHGFWVHTDAGFRTAVAICYFNKNWQAEDGGLLQLWQKDSGHVPGTIEIDRPAGRMDFLAVNKRIRTSTPGGGWKDGTSGPHDLILVDQIIPAYNRIFINNYQDDPAYHSVTPSNGRERTGFVQWLGVRRDYKG